MNRTAGKRSFRLTLFSLLRGLFFISLALPAVSCNRSVGDLMPELFLLDGAAPPLYSVSGLVTGLGGELFILENSNGDTVTLGCPAPCASPIDSDFAFPAPMHTTEVYNVMVLEYPSNPSQLCVVNQGSGVIGNAHVSNVYVDCNDAYRISGTIAGGDGLTGSGLALTSNGGDLLSLLPGTTAFTFHTPVYVTQGTSTVSVVAQPTHPWQTCTFSGSTTTTANYSSGDVQLSPLSCTTDSYDVSATIRELLYDGLVVNLNGVETTYSAGATSTVVDTKLSGEPYGISITALPPGQRCSLYGGGDGSTTLVEGSPVVADIVCTTETYTAGGSVSGLTGSGLTLETGGVLHSTGEAYANSVIVDPYKLSYVLSSSLHYDDTVTSVTIRQQPTTPDQYCAFADGSTSYDPALTVTGDLNLQDIICHTNIISGSVTGYLAPSLGLQIQYEDTATSQVQTMMVPSGSTSAYTFGTVMGHPYTMRVISDPYNPGLTCHFVATGSATVSGTITDSRLTQSVECTPLASTAPPVLSMSGLTNTLTMTPGSAGDTICYRLDGGNSGCSATAGGTAYSPGAFCASGSIPYTGPFSVVSTTTYQAVECSPTTATDQSIPVFYTATIAGTVITPVFTPAAGTYDNNLSVRISSATAGARIFYNNTGAAMDCSGAGSSGSFITGDTTLLPVTSSDFTLHAIACLAGYTPSAQVSSSYILQVSTPLIVHDVTGNVTITGATSGAFYRYTVDGTTPTCLTGNIYSGTFVYPEVSESIRVVGCKSGYVASNVVVQKVRIAVRYRVTGLTAGRIILWENLSSGINQLNFYGIGHNGPQFLTTYPAAGFDYRIDLLNNLTDPAPLCYLRDATGRFQAVQQNLVTDADRIVDVACPVFHFSVVNIFRTHHYFFRCPAGDLWDEANGGCIANGKSFLFCDTPDSSCDDGTYAREASPMNQYCGTITINDLLWRAPSAELLMRNAFSDPLINDPGHLNFPGVVNGELYWTGYVKDTSQAYMVVIGDPNTWVGWKTLSARLLCYTSQLASLL